MQTLGEWATGWFPKRANHVAPGTLSNEWSHYRRYFVPLMDSRLDELSVGRIKGWIDEIDRAGKLAKPGLGRPHTTRICFSLLSVMLRDAVEHRVIPESPMRGMRRPRIPEPQPKYLTQTDLDRLLVEVDASGDPRSLAVHLMVRLGLRRNEAIGLVWDDLDLDAGAVEIRFQLGREPTRAVNDVPRLIRRELKTMASRRRLPLSGRLLDRLRDLRDSLGETPPGPYLVSFDGGVTAVDPDALSHWLKATGKRVGVVVTPHRLRHTSATLLLNNGQPIEVVGRVLGHTDVKTTSVYARVLDASSDDAVRLLGQQLDAQPSDFPKAPRC
jgi:integrase